MAKFKFEGIEKYTASLEKIGGKNTDAVLRYAVYPGAKIVADAIRSEIEAHHRDTGNLAHSLGLSPMRNDNGYVNTKVVFAGYDPNKPSGKFPQGVPNAIKAAALESGTSRGQKATHFISKTTKSVTERAISEMSKALDQKLDQIMEG